MERLVRRLPSLRGLVAFEAAGRLGSFTKAAAELNVSQPAVSRQIRELETYLGAPLFRRVHGQVELTKNGRLYLDVVSSSLESVVVIGETISGTVDRPRVTISANFGFATFWLMPRLSLFQELRPDLEIAVRTIEVDEAPAGDNAEISIRFGNGDWPGERSCLIFEEIAYPVCSPTYLESAPPLERPEDLTNHHLLQIDASGPLWLDWKSLLNRLGIKNARIRGASYNNFTLSIQAALSGYGVAIGWDHLTDDLLSRGWLVRPIADAVETNSGYYAVLGNSAQSNEGAAACFSWLCGLSRTNSPSAGLLSETVHMIPSGKSVFASRVTPSL